jgi:hypothetical protein
MAQNRTGRNKSTIKMVYFSDFEGDHDQELDLIQERCEDVLGFKPNIMHTTRPPFFKDSGHEDFDVLFFDYGGIGTVGHSMFDHMSRALLEDAENHPSKVYIIVSTFTWDYMKEARKEFQDKLHNVFVSTGGTLAEGGVDPDEEQMKKALIMAGFKGKP